MKKAGERIRSFSIHAVFIVLVLASLYFIATNGPALTGHAVLNTSTAKAKLETALSSSSLFGLITSASMCVVINDATQPLSLQAVKDSSGWTVSEMKGFCTGAGYEDVIVQFSDYDSFSDVVDSPSPRNIATAAENGDFQVLPSVYVEQGGNVKCDAIFKTQYCTALKTMATEEKLIEGDLSCCIDQLTKDQKKLLETHLQQGSYSDEQKVLEQPTTIAGMSLTTIIGIGGGVLVLLIIIGVVALKGGGGGKKPTVTRAAPPAGAAPGMPVTGMPGTGMPAGIPGMPGAAGMPGAGMPAAAPSEPPEITELRNYVKGVMGQGYAPDDVRTHLLQIGWDSGTADKVIGEAYRQLQQGN